MSTMSTPSDDLGPLSLDEAGELLELEEQILDARRRAIAAYWEVGAALQAILDRRLYRETHASFDAYCRERWAIAKSQAYDLIDAAGTHGLLASAGFTVLPANERQARALKALPLDERPAFWGAYVATSQASGEEISARSIAKAAEKAPRFRERQDSNIIGGADRRYSNPALVELRETVPFPTTRQVARVAPELVVDLVEFVLRLPRPDRDRILMVARRLGMSGNQFVITAINGKLLELGEPALLTREQLKPVRDEARRQVEVVASEPTVRQTAAAKAKVISAFGAEADKKRRR